MHLVERTIPSKIIVLDALNRRAPSELITRLLKRAEIGYNGELKVDPLWLEMELPETGFLFHNYETPGHQLDTLFVCEYFIFVLEIKNVSGMIWYEEEKYQFLRKKRTGEIESFQSPFQQVDRHGDFVTKVVECLGLSIPIHKAVVIAEPSTIIGKVSGDIPIFHAIGLRTEVNKLLLKYQIPFLGEVHVQLLKDELTKLYQRGIYKPQFAIPPIRKGAICNCGNTMRYSHGRFVCDCGVKSKDPLYQGLNDYHFLYSEWITNKSFRNFFYVENEDQVNKLLKRLNFEYRGKTKGRKYQIPENIWHKDYNGEKITWKKM